MSYSNGVFTLAAGNPVVTGTTISSTVQNNTMNDVATGLSTCVLKDGTQTITANIPMSAFKLTGLAAGSTSGDSVRYEQFASPPSIGSGTPGTGAFTTLSVSATATLAAIEGAAIATQANQETATSLLTVVSPGRQQYHPSAPKAWAYFAPGGAPTFYTHYNGTSVAQNATGDYTITWSVTFSSTQYAAIVAIQDQPAADSAANTFVTNIHTLTATTTRIQSRRVSDGTRVDPSIGYCVAVYGDLS